MAVEFFQSKKKWGWRLRTTAIEVTRAATFATQDAAKVNALADVRAAMVSLGIVEAVPTPPPVVPPVVPKILVEDRGGGTVRVHWSGI